MANALYKRLMESKDPESTYKHMIDRYHPALTTIPGVMSKVRIMFRQDESNRRTGYQDEVMALIQTLPREHPDRDFLIKHLGSSLPDQEKHRHLKNAISDTDIHQQWKSMKLYDDWFYRWAPPEEVKRRLSTHHTTSQSTREMDAPVIPRSEMRQWYDTSLRVLEDLLKRVGNPNIKANDLVVALIEALLALCLMTGRRPEELAGETRSELTRVEGHPLQLRASRLAKKRGSEQPHVFPVLIDASIIVTALRIIRSTPLKRKGQEAEYLKASQSNTRTKHMKRLFGEKATYTTVRGVYTKLAFEDRKKSGFYPSAGYDRFAQLALGHTNMDVGRGYRNINED
jgi:integrase